MEITITLNDDQMDTLRSGRRLDIQSVLMDLVMPEFESADPIGVCQSCYGEYDKDELTETTVALLKSVGGFKFRHN